MAGERDILMTAKALEQIIMEGIRGLPQESFAEIADFVVFLRKKSFEPRAFQDDVEGLALDLELRTLSRDEQMHLEKEFADYEQRFPRD
jgi:hypothetical protein